jgi:hypothetical protein
MRRRLVLYITGIGFFIKGFRLLEEADPVLSEVDHQLAQIAISDRLYEDSRQESLEFDVVATAQAQQFGGIACFAIGLGILYAWFCLVRAAL